MTVQSATSGNHTAPGIGLPPTRLVVFSDDWGRHPSSCQHLTGHLLSRHPVLWVNTIGTRRPRFSLEDLMKITAKLHRWVAPSQARQPLPPQLTVINPWMYPGFRSGWQRRINAHSISAAVNRTLRRYPRREYRVAVTTVPLVADLVGRIDVDRWVYYCVDDFSVWPGLDGEVISRTERDLVARVDSVVAVSPPLVEKLQPFGCQPRLLTHGTDLMMWQAAGHDRPLPGWWARLETPVLLFWGVIDQRLDTPWCRALAQRCGSLVLVGPHQSPDPSLARTPRVHLPGPVAYSDLPALAAAADVLVMPYADLPVTRAMQPLKLKEYLATGKPAVVRKLPATTPWADAADAVETVQQLVHYTNHRAAHGTPPDQLAARRRLDRESWLAKADEFERMILGPAAGATTLQPGYPAKAA